MRYSKISYVKRTKLLDLVEKQGYGVTKAARILRLKVPTAKAILYTYRNKGHIYSKKGDKTVCNSSTEQNGPEVASENVRDEEDVASPLVIPQVEHFNYFPVYYWFPTIDYTNIVQF